MPGSGQGVTLELRDVHVHFNAQRDALAGIDLQVDAGERLVIIGPSGGGKTTLLRVIAGLTTPDTGSVHIDGADVTNTPPERRGAAMVFQGHALFPFRSVADNVGYGLRIRKVPRAQREARVRELLGAVQLNELGERFPAELSGGQRQRVALARALIVDPSVLLLDEPFSNLDPALRAELRSTVSDVQRRFGTTTVLVTHDTQDAAAMGDRVATLDHGKLGPLSTPTKRIDHRMPDVPLSR